MQALRLSLSETEVKLMNRIASRSGIVIILSVILTVGFVLFVVEFSLKSGDWVVNSGSAHVYNGKNLNCGVIVDEEGILLLDMQNDRRYSSDSNIRKATVHWLGDRFGKIDAPALAAYADEMIGYDILSGVYQYDETVGVAQMTLNAKVQTASLNALGNHKGCVAVYNYKTGEILCAVSTPSYDPDNVPSDIESYDGAYWNRFIQSVYIPGSIFKTVTLAAALESIPDIDSRSFFCSGECKLGSDVITCEVAHGTQSLKTAFTNSCNCVFAQLAQELGGDVLEKYVYQFGIIDAVQFDGITTASGAFTATDEPVFLGLSAIGQHEDQVNPCAFMTYMGAVANNGTVVVPHIVKKVSVADQTTYSASIVYGNQIMSEKTAETVREYMRNNVTQKYGDWNFPGLSVCAKTGTAEVGGDQKPNAMFTGFVSDEKYPLAFIVCVEDGGYGSTVCIPIASEVLAVCKDVIDNS